MNTATMQNDLAQELRRVLPEAFKRLSKEQVHEFMELCEMFSSSRDPEILESIIEVLVPESLGKPSTDARVDTESAMQVDDFQAKIGLEIKRLRVDKGWTQEQLAEKAGVKQSHISRLETGTHTPSDLTIQKIATALGVNPSKLDPGW